jgi:hypothetical protein
MNKEDRRIKSGGLLYSVQWPDAGFTEEQITT